MKTTAAPIRNEVVIDKPFVVAIVDNNTSAILFLGQITNPGGS